MPFRRIEFPNPDPARLAVQRESIAVENLADPSFDRARLLCLSCLRRDQNRRRNLDRQQCCYTAKRTIAPTQYLFYHAGMVTLNVAAPQGVRQQFIAGRPSYTAVAHGVYASTTLASEADHGSPLSIGSVLMLCSFRAVTFYPSGSENFALEKTQPWLSARAG